MSVRTPILALALSMALAAAGPGSRALKDGRQAEERGEFGQAYLYYAQAMALEPGNLEYRARAEAVRRRGVLDLKFAPADTDSEADADLADLPILTSEDLDEAMRLAPPPILRGDAGAREIDIEGDSKALFEKTLKAYGVDVVFDADYQPVAAQRFQLHNAEFAEALRSLENVTGSFVIALSGRLGMVAKDTVQKRSELEPHMAVTIPVPQTLSPQELQESARAVQSTFDIQKFGFDNAHGLVVFKDRVSRVRPAVELFRQLMAHRAQVLLEVDFHQIAENSALRWGMRLPTSFPIVNLSRVWNNVPSVPSGLGLALTFGSGNWLFGLGLSGAEVFASLTDGWTNILTQSRILTVTGQAATLHVGDRYPLQLQSYSGVNDGFVPPPTIQFEDLGVVLKVTPFVHGMDELTLDIEAELKVLGGQALNGIPVISNRKLQSRVRMKFGETAVLMGLVSSAQRKNTSGLPLLEMLPPFRSNDSSREKSDLLVTIRPRLTGAPPTETATPAMWVGTETRPLTPLDD